MADIKDQKLLYHITDIEHLPSILERGLLPRSALTEFNDVADPEIIESRQGLGLQDYVPFHFFGGSPFDGRVQLDHRAKDFVMITVRRTVAKGNGWKIIPRHPLARQNIKLMDYDDGFEAIDWGAMNARDYVDEESRSVCMAECLSSEIVSPSNFFKIYVPGDALEERVQQLINASRFSFYVGINEGMFVRSR